MKIAQAIRMACERLAAAGIDEAQIAAEYCLAELAGKPRLLLREIESRELPREDAERLHAMLARLARHEPLQYVLGYTEFHGRRFQSDPRALIPRPETEELVEMALAEKSVWKKDDPRIIDAGTGSGCIAITLAIAHPEARITAVDISADALNLARENAKMHAADSIEWRCGDLLEGIAPASADLIISNPPYIASTEMSKLERKIVGYEPHAALDGGMTGLKQIERLAAEAADVLRRGGSIFLEIGEEQGRAVRRILTRYGFAEIGIYKDLAGRERFAAGKIGSSAEFAGMRSGGERSKCSRGRRKI